MEPISTLNISAEIATVSVVENARGHAMRAALIALMLTVASQAVAECGNLCDLRKDRLQSSRCYFANSGSGCWSWSCRYRFCLSENNVAFFPNFKLTKFANHGLYVYSYYKYWSRRTFSWLLLYQSMCFLECTSKVPEWFETFVTTERSYLGHIHFLAIRATIRISTLDLSTNSNRFQTYV